MIKLNKQLIYNQLYALLMENGEYFRPQFGSMFDSDDDIQYEISRILQRTTDNLPLEYCQQPTKEFHNKLMTLVTQYIKIDTKSF